MDPQASALLTALFGATSFDEAARLTLRALLELADATLAASPWAGAGASCAASSTSAPPTAIAGSWSSTRTPARTPASRGSCPAPARGAGSPSTAAGRRRHQPRRGDAPGRRARRPRAPRRGSARRDDAREPGRLLARAASHILLLPLRAPGDAIDGMVSIEADCTGAIERPFVWPALIRVAQLHADVAAPFLAALPTERRALAEPDPYLPVVGPSMTSLVEMLRIFAEQEETVLLTGPTGSGKSRLARWCHHRSRRAKGPFETLDLATVPEELQLADLFGWKRGAFTGAARDTAGAVTRATGGTLFIDEIDKLSLRAQAGLLRVFEERRYRPLGEGASDRAADVRFLVSTNANVRELVKAGRFREDLYYRINVLPVQVPPLADLRDELADWARYMLRRRHHEASHNAPPPGEATIAPEALGRILAHAWPGNLRQLDNIVRRAYTLSLLQTTGDSRDVTLRAAHIDRALSLEGHEASPQLLELLAIAAEAFVSEAQRLDGAGGTPQARAPRGDARPRPRRRRAPPPQQAGRVPAVRQGGHRLQPQPRQGAARRARAHHRAVRGARPAHGPRPRRPDLVERAVGRRPELGPSVGSSVADLHPEIPPALSSIAMLASPQDAGALRANAPDPAPRLHRMKIPCAGSRTGPCTQRLSPRRPA
jgi:DNA-binding NtrC family response regulator